MFAKSNKRSLECFVIGFIISKDNVLRCKVLQLNYLYIVQIINKNVHEMIQARHHLRMVLKSVTRMMT